MGCNYPLKGWLSRKRNPATGLRSVVFDPKEGYSDLVMSVPCGQCIGCRLERSRQWAIRCVHEADLYEDNCFITLTYDDVNVPQNGSLRKSDFQKFMKRLRKEFSGQKIRYFMCGEYGDRGSRPHYHACLFNLDFLDKYSCVDKDGNKYYRSPTLEKLWPFGFSQIGEVTFESAGYVARYCLKKVTGDMARDHYGERIPEYVDMSRGRGDVKGIGSGWYDKFKDDVYPGDFVVVRGDVICRPPKYYDKKYSLTNSDAMVKIKGKRVYHAKTNPDNTPERLHAKHEVKKAKLKHFKQRRFEK